MKDVYITSALRTAVGSLGKSLKNIPLKNLVLSISSVFKESKIKR